METPSWLACARDLTFPFLLVCEGFALMGQYQSFHIQKFMRLPAKKVAREGSYIFEWHSESVIISSHAILAIPNNIQWNTLA